ncbi:uncharacterized protein KD926_009764 [Aspergillus affinis]|uniref:uncharacterized protein n=1 Tax=Aspergillus affinis TaxID=1070780 RepID=UPI0022FF4504|nr:uncharacterized protein KD926_009764 [Aspergillus affinis]KAI9039322.1 hypothetical protein KD926_009764 [Aspergillus affinis]
MLRNNIFDLNSYIEARISYARVLEKLHTRQAGEKLIKLLKKALIMRPDEPHVNVSLRSLLGLMFRLKSDDETYKFMRQYISALAVKYRPLNERPRDYNKMNALNDLEVIRRTPSSLILHVAFVILKLRVIAQLQDIPKVAGTKDRIVPKELKDEAHFGFLNAITTTEDDRCIIREAGYERLLVRLNEQVRMLILDVHRCNQQTWEYLMAKEVPANMFESQENSNSHIFIRMQLREPFEKTPGAVRFVEGFFVENQIPTSLEIKNEPNQWEDISLYDISMEQDDSD